MSDPRAHRDPPPRANDGEEPAGVTLTLERREHGERLDRVLAARDLGWSRSTIQRWIEEGRVTLDGVPATRKTRALAASTVVVQPAPPPPSEALPDPIPLVVLFEDAHVLVVDKPAGLVVHPAPGHPSGTLVNALVHHGLGVDAGTGLRPGIVHRLDKDTSGVMIVAKSPEAHAKLVACFQAHDLDRRYTALVVDHPPERVTYDTLYGRHPVHRKRFSSTVTRGKRAVTHVERLERFAGAARVECRLDTGRTHQIRVHLADHGTPVLGDPVYGRSPRDPRLRAIAAQLGRQALHASTLALAHPISGEPLRFETPPPSDLERALAALREQPAP
ncbi:MAG: RluA family pseudouridine synthase [Myxococcales bacterium]|nr:RluA family pseudouridine synthase [Myxococcales bacterium]